MWAWWAVHCLNRHNPIRPNAGGNRIAAVKRHWAIERERVRIAEELTDMSNFAQTAAQMAAAERTRWGEGEGTGVTATNASKALCETHGVQWDNETKPMRDKVVKLEKQAKKLRERVERSALGTMTMSAGTISRNSSRGSCS